MEHEEDIIDIATPYAIHNLTGYPFIVYPHFDQGKSYFVKNGENVKIGVKYEHQTNKSIDSRDDSKVTDDVKIIFTETNALPIECVAMNKTNEWEHTLFYETDEIVYHNVEVQNMCKVLIIRAAF